MFPFGARVCVGKTPRQGDTPQLNSAGLSAMSCHHRAMSQVYGAAVSIIATGLRDGAEAHLLAAIAGFTGKSAIKETCNTLTNGYTAVAKLTMTSPPLLSGAGDNVQSPVGKCA